MLAPDVLRRVPYFAQLDAGLLEELDRQVRQRTHRKGEVILLERAPCKGLYSWAPAGASTTCRSSRYGASWPGSTSSCSIASAARRRSTRAEGRRARG